MTQKETATKQQFAPLLTGPIAFFGIVAKVLDELDLETIGIDVVNIFTKRFDGTIVVLVETGSGQSLYHGIEAVNHIGKMREAGLLTVEVTIVSFAIIVQGQVLIIIADVQPLTIFAVPLALTLLANAPVWEGRLVKLNGSRDIANNEIEVFQVKDDFSPLGSVGAQCNTSS